MHNAVHRVGNELCMQQRLCNFCNNALSYSICIVRELFKLIIHEMYKQY